SGRRWRTSSTWSPADALLATSATTASMSTSRNSVWPVAIAGLAAVLVGIGLARFAYTPLIPALISEGWFGQSDAVYLGAANLAGYLAGAILGRLKTRWISRRAALRGAMLVTAVSLLACAWRDLGFPWFFLWRFVSGYTGGIIMVLAAPTALALT